MNFTPYTAIETSTGRRVQVVGKNYTGETLVIGYAGETETHNVPASAIQPSKTVEARVMISTNPATAHIGRYFIDVRDTTGGRNRQLTTRVADPAGVADFLSDLAGAAKTQHVDLVKIDQTGGELAL